MATTNEYDMIILDLMLPKMDGIQLCRKLREEKIGTPVMMLTAMDDVKDKVTGLDSGADDYLTKPFAFEELLARTRSQLRKRQEKNPTQFKVADITLDLLTHRVDKAGQNVILTAKEFSLLEYLMRHAGTIVTRTMISEHVWDIHFDVSTNVIDVYINYLRRKIDTDPAKKLIQTVRGRGYILQE
jgi:DNA-binding response OmpR family regulator